MKSEDAAWKRVRAWAGEYAPLPGIPDEFVGPDGEPRPHWRGFLEALAQYDESALASRFAAADRRIRDMGISYRAYGESQERSWPLSRMPLLLDAGEWAEISAGVAQRAELLERVLADLYGPARLVAENALPAAAIAGSPDYLRAMQGVTPPGGKWLRFYAADIGRGPDGRWWVLGDRAQAPSGAGYALENRLVTSRAFPTLYARMNVERLAPFFRDFRDGLRRSARRAEPRIGLLTQGPWSETYFEQTYLARYLGFLLVQGADLAVDEGKVYVRTIAGFKRVDVLWRRIDGDSVDPLELDAASQIGVPGLLEAIRDRAVVVANMPGSGVVESRSLLAFLPALARRVLREDLKMPNIATWWCGQDSARSHVLDNLDNLAVASSFDGLFSGFGDREAKLGADLDAKARAAFAEGLKRRGVDYVGQEIVRLSTMPVWKDGALTPAPFSLRVFAAATPDGWQVMPGGFCRVSGALDARAVAMRGGVESADVWVLSERPVETTSLLPSETGEHVIRLLGNLPSRAADNLFWFGRYLERAEATLRLVRGLFNRAVDVDAPDSGERGPATRLRAMLVAWGAIPKTLEGSTARIAAVALHSGDDYGSVLRVARAVRAAAAQIRERLSLDVWRLLERFERTLIETAGETAEPELLETAEECLSLVAGVGGLLAENFNRVAGWRFLDIGRRIERGVNVCRLARQFADAEATGDTLDALLDLIDSQITYRSRYIAGVATTPVLDMALLDPFNPRSAAFQASAIDDHLAGLPVLRDDGILEKPKRMAVTLRAAMATQNPDALDTAGILKYEQQLEALADAIAERYFLQGADRPRIEKMTGLA